MLEKVSAEGFEIPESAWLWFAKLMGSIAGSAVSIAYLLPRGKREAALRFSIGIIAGLVFGSVVGVKFVDELGMSEQITAFEATLSGSAMASLGAWWVLGIFSRLANRIGRDG